ncbi:MAG: NaeI family type II restriction endonuclease [Cellulomonadaceae bacterium]|jgi:hypothetical protein|nr:NaeI family type II restriction endonuclease [Cellulomonadaceae bacterium]
MTAVEVLRSDAPLAEVFAALRDADQDGLRFARVFRDTFDQLYDGQHTGRFRWEQLNKTEKTHFGTLIEINLRREFSDVIDDGDLLDYRICGFDIDCKYSQKMGGWMLPPECFDQLLIVAQASDDEGCWSVGLVRATQENRRTSENRDRKSGLNEHGRSQIVWLHYRSALPPNILLHLDDSIIKSILAKTSGQQRINELLRRVTNMRIGRNTIATLAQQADYMKRLRDNGGARGTLRAEGYLIPGGDYDVHKKVARDLGAMVPERGEVVSLRVTAASSTDEHAVALDGALWRLAGSDELVTMPAPRLPDTRNTRDS